MTAIHAYLFISNKKESLYITNKRTMSQPSNITFTGIKKPREDASRVVANGIRTKSLLVEDNIKIEDNAEIIGNLTISGECYVDDTLNVTNDYLQYGYTLLPKFSIIMFGGSLVQIPTGWLLCDGRTVIVNDVSVTAPDLRGRFILSYGQGPLDFPNTTLAATGGEQKHVLSVNELPAHSHTTNANAPSVGLAQRTGYNTGTTFDSSGGELDLFNAASLTINNTGEGLAHNTMPPYYVMCFIMKGF
jgi:microcystin-dependent protein